MKRKILLVTNLYPNSKEPVRGLYVRQLVQHLRNRFEVRVVAPVPRAPAWAARRWRPSVLVPAAEVIDGVQVYHPAYVAVPKVLRFSHGFAYAAAIARTFRKLRIDYPFDLVSVHWLFPDAFGTVLAARSLGVPVVAHALGCDVNDYMRYPIRRRMICWALHRATAVVTKSEEIAGKLVGLGIHAEKVQAIHNGVDRSLFHRRDKVEQRRLLGVSEDTRLLLFIGNLSPEKGVHYLLRAAAELRSRLEGLRLLIVGEGALRGEIEREIARLRIGDTVRLEGRVGHDLVPRYLSAADVLCLPSIREGCPNVVLEALASGTAVVASSVGAIPEIMTKTRIGLMAAPADVEQLAGQILRAFELPEQTDRSFTWGSWEDNVRLVGKVFEESIGTRNGRAARR